MQIDENEISKRWSTAAPKNSAKRNVTLSLSQDEKEGWL